MNITVPNGVTTSELRGYLAVPTSCTTSRSTRGPDTPS